MELNEKCMRDILKYCVDDIHVTTEGKTFTMIRLFHIPKHFSEQYDKNDIVYSVKKLIELNYISISDLSDFDGKWQPWAFVHDVTYEGHKYLESTAN